MLGHENLGTGNFLSSQVVVGGGFSGGRFADVRDALADAAPA